MKTKFSSIEPLEARIAPATIIVTSLLDTSDPGKVTLRDALALADDPSHPGADTIIFNLPAAPAPGANIIKLNGTELTSGGNVTIKGPGAGKLILDGDNASRIFDFNDNASSADSPVSITGLSILHGNGTGLNSGQGGAIFSDESLTLKKVVISGNTATGAGGGVFEGHGTFVMSDSLISGNIAGTYAGGLDLYHLDSITISKTVVSGNSAAIAGGGIYGSVVSLGTGITLTGCAISGNTASRGGGVYLNDNNAAPASKITISGTKITNNTATNSGDVGGGGLFLAAGNAVITGSTIGGNTAVYNGGGIYAGSGFTSLTISKSTISGNRTTASGSSYNGGGGVFIKGASTGTLQPVNITNSIITDNESGQLGGGLFASGGVALTVSKSTVSGNHASFFGGGLYTRGYTNDRVDLTISGGVIADNTSPFAGGFSAEGDGAVTVTFTKISGNTATTGNGGGMYIVSSAAVLLKNLTVSGNFAANDGGGVKLTNTANATISGGSFINNAAAATGGAIALKSSSATITGVTITGNAAVVKGGGVFNGGSSPGTVTFTTPKITGNTAPLGPNVFGNVIGFGAPAAPRAGRGTFVVTTVNDVVDPNDNLTSLREALALADADPATVDTIGFALPAVDFVNGAWIIKLNGTELASKGNVKIVGPGAGKLILDGDNASRVLHFDVSGTDNPVSISGLSIVHGNAAGDRGGGILSNESLTLKNTVFSGNVADLGGGLAVHSGVKANVSSSLFTGNTGNNGSAGLFFQTLQSITIDKTIVTGNISTKATGGAGGIYATVKAFNGSPATIDITKSLISGNKAAYGGGLYVRNNDNAPASHITISGTTISGNVASATTGSYTGGGGLFISGGDGGTSVGATTISGCTIQNNTAAKNGGGIYAGKNFASLTISKSSISGNRTTAPDIGGGGLFVNGGNSQPVNISKSTIADNQSAQNGGGVFASSNVALTLSKSIITGNRAANHAGGILSSSSLILSGSTIADNTAKYGGGINAGNAVIISTSKITGNVATVTGGGLYIANTTGTVTLQKNVVSGNFSINGGGLFMTNVADFAISGGAFTGNSAGSGGGILLDGVAGSILGVSITGNVAGGGGGIFNKGSTANAITLQIAKVIANSGFVAPNVGDNPGDLSTFVLV